MAHGWMPPWWNRRSSWQESPKHECLKRCFGKSTGRVAPPRNPEALANAWEELLKMEPEQRRQLGLRARQRIQERYSLDAVVRQYEALFREVVEGTR